MARRNQFIERLLAGETVKLKGNGNSMVPRIYSGDRETLEPVDDPTALKVGDMVYCKVKGSVFTHLITAIKIEKEQLRFQISNNHGHVNGWIGAEHIYGRCIEVEGKGTG